MLKAGTWVLIASMLAVLWGTTAFADPICPAPGSGSHGGGGGDHPLICPSPSTEPDPCTDLFGAACLKPDGTFRTMNLQHDVNGLIHHAFDATLHAMGAESLDKAYAKFCADNGHAIKPGLSHEQMADVLSGHVHGNPGDYFQNFPPACQNHLELSADAKDALNRLRDDYAHAVGGLEARLSNLDYEQRQPDEEGKADRIAVIQADIERRERILEALQQDADAIVRDAVGRAADERDELLAKGRRFFEGHFSQLVSGILAFCGDVIPGLIEQAKHALDEKKSELAHKDQSHADPIESPNEAIKDFKAPEECTMPRLYRVRSAAVELSREHDEKKARDRAKQLVATFYPTFLKLRDLASEIAGASPSILRPAHPPVRGEVLDEHESDLRRVGTERANACLFARTVTAAEIFDMHHRFFGNLAKARPTVESLLDATYGPERRKTMNKLYQSVHTGIMEFIQNDLGALPSLKGKARLRQITDSMRGLTFSWHEKPGDALYKRDPKFPLPVLDFDKLPANDDFFVYFQDPSLSIFRQMNAFYSPSVRVGTTVTAEAVNLLPAINILAEKDKYAAMAIMAHEIGHKIGYLTSRVNGYDLTPEYEKLVCCLSTSESIGLRQGQADEAIADWISATVMGRLVLARPANERKSAALHLASFFCEAHGDDFYRQALDLREAHPDATLRVNGIFGANRNVREALGCHGKKGNYRECGLNGEVK